MNFSDSKPGLWRRPWRLAAAGWIAAALTLVAGVPLFLCMPPWNDVTLYDMAVRSVLHGGVHYRDVFDTNLPGVVWTMAVIRTLFGGSYEVLRAFDLLVLGASVGMLGWWVRKSGSANYSVAWFVAAAAFFYLGTAEFNHMQRDPWMLLPAMLAMRLRLKRVCKPIPPPPPSQEGSGGGLYSILEGFLWGAAVWLKPHAAIVAFAVWLVSVLLLARSDSRARIATDFGGLILGGLLAGVPGVLWIIGSGAWPYFLDIFLNWNPTYLSESVSIVVRFRFVFDCFGAWSLIHCAAIPLALRSFWDAYQWSRRPDQAAFMPSSFISSPLASSQEASARALLAAMYLAWLAQVVILQKPFEYAHVPPLLLAMAVVAGQRWCFGFAYLLGFLAIGFLVNVAGVPLKFPTHPLTNPHILELWPRCWREGGSPELRDRLGQYTDTEFGTNWRDLNAVAEFLRHEEPSLGPGELNCWHDTTHPLYLMLDLDPATRYMHYGTVFNISSKRELIAEAVRASKQRYVVTDSLHTTRDPNKFPWNQPVVFRTERYVVHKIDPNKPLGEMGMPDW